MRYWDTSTLAKLYCDEPDTPLYIAHMRVSVPAGSSVLTRWELFRVFARKEAEGMIGAGQAQVVFQRFLADVEAGVLVLMPFHTALEERFQATVNRLHRRQPPIFTRTLDCIHLASAAAMQAEEVVVTDAGFRRAALALGLQVFP